ncbi:MAG: hypothetical protein RLP44_06715 [Aggregatilineales bacterium]
MSEIVIKPLRQLAEMYDAVTLQQVYWGTDVESVVPAHMLFSIASYGGQVLVAMDGERMVGVLIGLLGADNDALDGSLKTLFIASKRMVVLPEYRSQGIGYALKLAQREQAIKQGLELVSWTFDPLLSRNAHLNLRKLGAICPKYIVNLYGDSGNLSTLGSSDRFAVEWWIKTADVETRVSGHGEKPILASLFASGAVIVNPTTQATFAQPAETLEQPDGNAVLVEIPPEFPDIINGDERLARAWREHTRGIFQELMAQGYVVVDFVHETMAGRHRAFYLLRQRA